VNVRDAVPADAEIIRTVHRDAIVELGPTAYDEKQVEAWAAGCDSMDYTANITRDGTEVLVAEQGGIVGFGSLTLAEPEDCKADADAEVTAVYVHPDATREGVGSTLYEELERRARVHGAGTLALHASRNAVAFYESHGYERVTEHTHEFSTHEATSVTGTVVEMRKEL
jgi:putative acetyltransferase